MKRGRASAWRSKLWLMRPTVNTRAITSETTQLRGLYVLTDARLGGGHEALARAALAGGAKILQLRDKTTPASQILLIARQIRLLTWQNNAIFLINDDVELALNCEADGVHLGADDMPVLEARRRLADKIIGVSTSSPQRARAAERDGASYLGVGAVFGTQTKSDAGAPIGLEGLRALSDATTLPVAAIGGVSAEHIAAVFAAGARMACVISALCAAGENEAAMEATARQLVALCDAGLSR